MIAMGKRARLFEILTKAGLSESEAKDAIELMVDEDIVPSEFVRLPLDSEGNVILPKRRGRKAVKVKELEARGYIPEAAESQLLTEYVAQGFKLHDCMRILPDLGIFPGSDRWKALNDIAEQAAGTIQISSKGEKVKSRGIPTLLSPYTYEMARRGGPKKRPEMIVSVDGEKFKITQPTQLSVPAGVELALWVEFEKELLEITTRNMPSISEDDPSWSGSDYLKRCGISWHPSRDRRELGIPDIHPLVARKVLKEADQGRFARLFDHAPFELVGSHGFRTDFVWFCLDVIVDKVQLSRLERFCLAMILAVPIGRIEYKIYSVAMKAFSKGSAIDSVKFLDPNTPGSRF